MKETYTIPTAAREAVMKAIARLQKKAVTYGKTLTVEESEPYAKERDIVKVDFDRIQRKVGTELVEAFDITIESDIVVKDGYTVVARIEHLEGGNVIQMFNGEDAPAEWQHIAPNCEHCGHKRERSVTFIVCKDGSTKQIGKTCLKDYCGINPQNIGMFNQLRTLILDEYAYEVCDLDREDFGGSKAYDVQTALAFAIRIKRKHGYRKSAEMNSNRDILHDLMLDGERATDEEMDSAKQLMNGIAAIPDEESRGMIFSVQSIIRTTYCKASHFGYLAYAPVAYEKHLEYMERENRKRAAKEQERQSSAWVGEVGKRMVLEIESCELVTSWENAYGYTYLHKMITKQGATLVWFASQPFERAVPIDNELKEWKPFKSGTIKATIKEHSERDGVKQTIVARCAVVA